MNYSFTDLWAIIVSYHPNIPALRDLCKNLYTSGVKVVVVDNTEDPFLTSADLPPDTMLHSLYFNSGIAYAQNVGITSAMTSGAWAIAFFDQDSIFDNSFLFSLISELHRGVPNIVSPRCIDIDTFSELPSQRLTKFGFVKPVYCDVNTELYSVDITISSGSVATREVFELAGKMDENLFIDYVDTEWCLRCRSKKIPISVVTNAVMWHRIGSKTINVGPLRISIHDPTRCYYQIRNSFHLFRKGHVPWSYATMEMSSVFLNRLLLLRHVHNRINYLRAYVQGFRDGLLGAVGARKVY